MAGNNRQKKSSFSLFGLFKSKNNSRSKRVDDENVKACKVYPSDEDRGRWVADPDINKKADAYIKIKTGNWKSLDVAN